MQKHARSKCENLRPYFVRASAKVENYMRDDVTFLQDRLPETEDVLTDSETEIESSQDAAATTAIGRVAAPFGLEATTGEFYFWIRREHLPENNQFVRTESTVGGEKIEFYAVIDELKRGGRRKTIDEEYDVFDGEVGYDPPFKTDGVTYARAQILRSSPEIDTPPHEQSLVHLGGEREAKIAYGFEEMSRPMAIGLLKNGASRRAGLGMIDLDYLLGENGGHLNVNGVAGVGTKTTFLLTVVKMLQKAALDSLRTSNKLFVVPIILNVKSEDLMWLNKPNKRFEPKHENDWRALGVEPTPFADAEFYEPQGTTAHGCDAKKYSWSLQDVLFQESLLFIFSEDDNLNENMTSLVREIVARITEDDGKKLRSDENTPRTWKELLEWIRQRSQDEHEKFYNKSTWRAVYRRLRNVLDEGAAIFPLEAKTGDPLNVVRDSNSPPLVVNINALPYSLQRFVVGTILKQTENARKGEKRKANLRYVVMLDELNRFAPKNAKDEITKQIERVATEMRSQGIILLGAQQNASQVSAKVIENSSIRVLGRTGAAELGDKVWSAWQKSARDKAAKLQASEKLVLQPTFRQPMLVHVPMNPWADKKDNIAAAKIEKDLKKLL